MDNDRYLNFMQRRYEKQCRMGITDISILLKMINTKLVVPVIKHLLYIPGYATPIIFNPICYDFDVLIMGCLFYKEHTTNYIVGDKIHNPPYTVKINFDNNLDRCHINYCNCYVSHMDDDKFVTTSLLSLLVYCSYTRGLYHSGITKFPSTEESRI